MLIALGKNRGNFLLQGTKRRNIPKISGVLFVTFLVIFLFKPACIIAGEEKLTYTSAMKFTAVTEYAQGNSKKIDADSAGLISHVVNPEVIPDVNKIDKNNALINRIMAWKPILYALDHWVIPLANKEEVKTCQGNLEGIKHYSSESSANAFAVGIAAIATFQGYRLIKTQTWAPEWLKSEFHDLKISPHPSGGFVFSFDMRF